MANKNAGSPKRPKMRGVHVFSAAGIVKLQALEVRDLKRDDGAPPDFELIALNGSRLGFISRDKIGGWVYGEAMPAVGLPQWGEDGLPVKYTEDGVPIPSESEELANDGG
jgi:hypothetical protein